MASARWRSWFLAVLIVAGLVAALAHWGEVRRFAALLREAEPGWIVLALALQLTTYANVARGWSAVLRQASVPRPIRPLMRIALSKLFADQVLPSAGMGGNILLGDQLRALGVPKGTAVAALLLSMIGFYAAYAFFALVMLILLWLHDRATPLMAGTVTIFLLVALAIPSLALWLRSRGSRPLPDRIEQIDFVRRLLETAAQAPAELLRDRRLILTVTGCNAMIFLADAGTLYACLHSLGQQAAFGTAFIALIMASVIATLGPIPLGLGSFEATSVAMLHLLGVALEAAFAATMLLRLFTLWLPLIPGMVMMRAVAKRKPADGRQLQ
ncbi:MAG TPA: lysylphosphatidylglycerol synthase transmembrane domain-containing protein [Sphingobium sp.]|nr:lysylphosphatidylglycerol synthase transmembrane domain-containing protein [Sphingobium sp.]